MVDEAAAVAVAKVVEHDPADRAETCWHFEQIDQLLRRQPAREGLRLEMRRRPQRRTSESRSPAEARHSCGSEAGYLRTRHLSVRTKSKRFRIRGV